MADGKLYAIIKFQRGDDWKPADDRDWKLTSHGLYRSEDELLEGVRKLFEHVRVVFEPKGTDLDGLAMDKYVSWDEAEDYSYAEFTVSCPELAGDRERMFRRLMDIEAGNYGYMTKYDVAEYEWPEERATKRRKTRDE